MESTTTKKSIERILAQHQIKSDVESQTNENLELKNEFSKTKFHPTPIDKEIALDPSRTIMSKTDARGIIEYANDYFMEISGYDEFELMGQPHNKIRHPEMPQVIFKLLWERLNKGENIHAFVKNLAKDGSYYWVLTNFETKYNEEGIIISHYARRKAAPKSALYTIDKLYKILRAIELKQGMKTAERYFNGLLEEKGLSYDEYILSILNIDENILNTYFDIQKPKEEIKKKSSLLGRLFK